jgi:type IV secretion system protein VirB6
MAMYKYIIYILISIILSSCDGDRCIEADDFGFERLDISVRYKDEDIIGSDQNQVAKWIDSGLKINGDPLTIVIRNWQYTQVGSFDNNNGTFLSAWCPWFGDKSGVSSLSAMCKRLPECAYIDGEMCDNPMINNAPCIMKHGVGLYGLITDVNPNNNMISMRLPNGESFHLGTLDKDKKSIYNLYNIDENGNLSAAGGIIIPAPLYDITKTQSLYFKILDSYYGDDSGQYKIVIKSGIHSKSTDPIEYVTKKVENLLFGDNEDAEINHKNGLIHTIFSNLVNQPSYKYSINSILIIYLIVTAILFLLGFVQMTHAELSVRVFKILVISQLLSPGAYTFFYNNLFFLFIDGWDFLKGALDQAAETGPGGQTIISLMMASETLKKLLSLLFLDWKGLVFIIVYLVLFMFLIFVY